MSTSLEMNWKTRNCGDKYNEDDLNLIITTNDEIYFTAEINTANINKLISSFNKVVQELKSKNTSIMTTNNNKKININLYIDSPGGELIATFKFIDYINNVRKIYNIHLTTIGIGMIASAGTLIFAVGDKKLVTENATCMIHELFAGNVGKYTELISGIKYLKDLYNKIINIYLISNTKINKEKLLDYLKSETWFTSSEYIEDGFADGLF
jgi:ATP-dependent protease ClpP protease subunit